MTSLANKKEREKVWDHSEMFQIKILHFNIDIFSCSLQFLVQVYKSIRNTKKSCINVDESLLLTFINAPTFAEYIIIVAL